MDAPDPLKPEAALAALGALPLEERPQVLLRLAEDLERRIDAAVAPDEVAAHGGEVGVAGVPTVEQSPREP